MPTPSKFPLPDNEHSFGTDPPSMTRRFANIAHQSDKASPQSWLCSFLRAEKLTSQRARGTRVDYVYNRRNQLTRMLQTKAATVLLGLSYLLNPDGSRASIIEQTHAVDAQQHALFNADGSPQLEQQRRTDYVYDDLKRLVHEAVDARIDSNDRTTAWTYDKVGNRQTQSQQNGVGALAGTAARRETIAYTYDANDRLLTETTSTTADAGATSTTEATTHRYDLNGNLLETSTPNRVERYRWNAENRLVQHEKTTNGSTAITQYAYTADGIRNKIVANATTANAITTRQLIDPVQAYAQVLEETIAIGANAPQLKAVYTHGDDLIAQYALKNSDGSPATSGVSYLHYDGLGTTRFLTNASGAITDRYTYQAFGDLDEAATTYAFGSSAATDYLFTGEQYDPNLGFYYLRARYLNPSNGRFVSQDSWMGSSADPATLHKYLYANGSPGMFRDPSGHMSLPEAMQTVTNLAIKASLNVMWYSSRYPKLTFLAGLVLNAMLPDELQVPTPINLGSLSDYAQSAGKDVVKATTKQFSAMARSYLKRGSFTTLDGDAFEKAIAVMLRADRTKKRVNVKVDGVGYTVYPEFYNWRSVLEIKTTFGAMKRTQVIGLAAHAIESSKPLEFMFFKKPTDDQLEKLGRWVAEGADGREIKLAINYFFE